jgi:hypothetical protein
MIRPADVTASVPALTGKNAGNDGKGFPLAVDLPTMLISNRKDGEIKAKV